MNYPKISFRSLLACCALLSVLASCSHSEELPEIEEAKLIIQASGGCDFVEGETTHTLVGPADPGYDPDWDLVVHVQFPEHPIIDYPCGHTKDEFCVFYGFEQPNHPSFEMGIRYANDQGNTIHLLTPDGNQGYIGHQAEPIPGSPNHNPQFINGQPRPNKGWHKVCAESNDYYVHINFGPDAPDVPMESIVLESSGICVVANIGTGGGTSGGK